MADERDYEVGYGKPPKATRFPPKTSGNPKGRPKGARGVKTIIREVLTAPVVVKADGKTRTVPAFEAVYLRLRQKALEGGERAMGRFFAEVAQHLPDEAENAATSLAETDQQILETFFRLRPPPTEPPTPDSSGQQTEEIDDE